MGVCGGVGGWWWWGVPSKFFTRGASRFASHGDRPMSLSMSGALIALSPQVDRGDGASANGRPDVSRCGRPVRPLAEAHQSEADSLVIREPSAPRMPLSQNPDGAMKVSGAPPASPESLEKTAICAHPEINKSSGFAYSAAPDAIEQRAKPTGRYVGGEVGSPLLTQVGQMRNYSSVRPHMRYYAAREVHPYRIRR